MEGTNRAASPLAPSALACPSSSDGERGQELDIVLLQVGTTVPTSSMW